MAISSGWKCLGHEMTLRADGGVLTGCRWIGGEADDCSGNAGLTDVEIIDLAKAQIAEYLEGRRKEFSVPVRIKGTEFRMRVWEELRRIPYGATITYKQLAERIGNPKAVRAVANACGANPLPIIIPCHRVIASGGRPGGYTGGLDIKLNLLDIEKQNGCQ